MAWARKGDKNINVNDVLIFDIETSSQVDISDDNYVRLAKMKWFGAFSFKHNRYFYYTHKDMEKIQKLIDEHRVIVGFNSKAFDIPICENNKLNFEYKVRIDLLRCLFIKETRRPVRENIIKVKGKILRDILPNHKLKTIAEVLGFSVMKGEIDYALFRKDRWTSQEEQEILKYLHADIVVTKELFEFLYKEFLPMKEFMSEEDQRKYNWFRTSTGSYTYKVICHQAGLKEEYAEVEETDEKRYKGGYVVQPTEEYYDGDMVVLDFSSAYPHAFMMANLYSHDDSVDAWKGNDMFPVSGSYSTKEMGVIEKVIKMFYNLRLKYKAEGDKREQAVKIIINTAYGISGSPVFKSVFNIDTASDCTMIVRNMIKHTRKVFETNGYDLIYSDTDSIYLRDNFHDREKLLRVKQQAIDEIKANLPLPQDTFDMTIDDEIKAMWFFKDEFDEFKKKNYVYITKKDKIKIKGIALIKSGCSRLAKEVYARIKPTIEKDSDIKFSREFFEEMVMDLIKKDITLVANFYKVKHPSRYKSKTCIHYQIANTLGEGEWWLVPNDKIGKIGKSKKYCTVEEAQQLTINDLRLDTLWNTELSPFIADFKHPNLLKRMEKAKATYEREKEKETQAFLDSDLFDSEAVGMDISDGEFLENEQWFAMND